MGLFDGFREQVKPALSVQQAIMTVVVAAVMADGDVADEEVSRIRSMCLLSPIFASNSAEQDSSVIKFAINYYSQLRDQAIEGAAEVLSPDLRETAFMFASDMVLADGLVGSDEEAFLAGLMGRLGIAEATGRTLVWAALVRNRAIK